MTWLFGASSFKVAGREVIQEHLLADGGFAYVYRGRDAQTGEALAIRKALLQDSQAQQAARLEMTLLERLPYHDSIVRFLGAEILEGEARKLQAVSLFELCTGGTLFARVEAVKQQAITAAEGSQLRYCCPCLPEAEVLAVLRNASSALNHLHAHGVIHYDVKSENLMLGADGLWKLGDFGSASERTFEFEPAAPRKVLLEVEEFVHGRCTPIFRAPEVADVHLRWPIGHKVDVFALGCVLFACLTGIHPFPMDSALANIQLPSSRPSYAGPSSIVSCVRRPAMRIPARSRASGAWTQQVLPAALGVASARRRHLMRQGVKEKVLDMSQLEERLQEMQGLRVRDLRHELEAMGISTAGRVDRESLPPPKNPFKDTTKPPVAAEPEICGAESRIHLMRAVSDQGFKTNARVITIELEVGCSPLRFVVDTASYHSIMKEGVVRNIFQARFCGQPDWAREEAPGSGIRQAVISNAWLADGKISCGEVSIATIDQELPVPTGCAGILGLDFLTLFDWDFDIKGEKARIATAPKERKAPLPFDVSGMIPVPLLKIRTPSQNELYACQVKLSTPGQDLEDPEVKFIQGFPDLASSNTFCNKIAAKSMRKITKATSGKGFGPTVEKKRKFVDVKTEEINAVFGIGNGPEGCAVREGTVLAGDVEAFQVLRLTEWPTAILGADLLARYQIPVEAELAYASKLLRWLKDLLQRHPSDRPDAGTLSKQVQAFLAGEAP
eukprot:symbB.v1.2.023110.t2/scaffold2093.1/size89838/7